MSDYLRHLLKARAKLAMPNTNTLATDTEGPMAHKAKVSCSKCPYTARSSRQLKMHLTRVHQVKKDQAQELITRPIEVISE